MINSEKSFFKKNEVILGISFLSLVLLLDFILPVVKWGYMFNLYYIEFLNLHKIRIVVSLLFALSMYFITNKYPSLKLSPVTGMIVGAIFGLYVGCKIAI